MASHFKKGSNSTTVDIKIVGHGGSVVGLRRKYIHYLLFNCSITTLRPEGRRFKSHYSRALSFTCFHITTLNCLELCIHIKDDSFCGLAQFTISNNEPRIRTQSTKLK